MRQSSFFYHHNSLWVNFRAELLSFIKKTNSFVNRLLSDALETHAQLKTGFFRCNATSYGVALGSQFVIATRKDFRTNT
jgi:hypothetical protein